VQASGLKLVTSLAAADADAAAAALAAGRLMGGVLAVLAAAPAARCMAAVQTLVDLAHAPASVEELLREGGVEVASLSHTLTHSLSLSLTCLFLSL
jgi:hypothetical protein